MADHEHDETDGVHASPAPHPGSDPLVPGGTALIPGTAPSMALARSLPIPTDALPTVSAYDLFVCQMSSDSSEARIDAMRRLSVVAAAMGTDDCLSTLFPYLASNVAMNEEEEDEVLLLLADQLGNLVPGLIPGSRALPALPLLERIASAEETVVRDKAVESINKVVPCLAAAASAGGSDQALEGGDADSGGDAVESAAPPAGGAPALLLAMAKRLAGADWFTAKISAAGILPAVYRFFHTSGSPGSSEACREIRSLYKKLSDDETPMVRRSSGKHLGKFVEAVAHLPKTAAELSEGRPDLLGLDPQIRRVVLDEIVPMYQGLGTDEQDSVRLLAVAASGSVGCALGIEPELTSDLVYPVVRGGCQDLSW